MYHPLRYINFCMSNYQAFPTYEAHELESYVTEIMIQRYRKLYYNFNEYINFCNLCNRHTHKPLEVHLLINCKKIK